MTQHTWWKVTPVAKRFLHGDLPRQPRHHLKGWRGPRSPEFRERQSMLRRFRNWARTYWPEALR